MNTIYTLTHPVSKAIYYVGFTTKDTAERLAGHISKPEHASTKSLASIGLQPIITVIDRGIDVNVKTEMYWIKKMLEEGHPLENRDGVFKYQEKDVVCFSSEEIVYIESLPKEERYELIIRRILNELPRNSSFNLVNRIKNLCETALK